MATNTKIYWNFERPVRVVASVALPTQGLGLTLDTTLGDYNASVPKYKFPAAGARVDGFTLNIQNTVGGFVDLVQETGKYVPAQAGATFGLGIELAVTAAGLLITATTGQYVVAKSVVEATAVNQNVTVLAVAPYLKA